MSSEKLLKVEEVALLIGCSVYTINLWYRFKRNNPDNEYAQMLPDYIQSGSLQTRYWKESDVYKLIDYQTKLPKGRNGVMGNTSRKYYNGGKRNGKKKTHRNIKNRNK